MSWWVKFGILWFGGSLFIGGVWVGLAMWREYLRSKMGETRTRFLRSNMTWIGLVAGFDEDCPTISATGGVVVDEQPKTYWRVPPYHVDLSKGAEWNLEGFGEVLDMHAPGMESEVRQELLIAFGEWFEKTTIEQFQADLEDAHPKDFS
jgi:hypothetical protein